MAVVRVRAALSHVVLVRLSCRVFPEYEVGDTSVPSFLLAPTAVVVMLVVEEPCFSWLGVAKVFKIKKNLLFATTVNRQQ